MRLPEQTLGNVQSPDLSPLRQMRTVREELEKLNPAEVRSATPEEQKGMVVGVLESARAHYVGIEFLGKAGQLEPIIAAVTEGRVTFDELLEAATPTPPRQNEGGVRGFLGRVRKTLR